MSKVSDLVERNRSLCAKRDNWKMLWQELADIYHPAHGGFTTQLIPGRESQIEIYDTTPMQARRGLATAIDGLLKPATTKWFWMRAKNENLNEDDEAKRWFEHVQDRMWSAIYDPLALFIPHSGAVDNDLATFGIGYLWMGERKAKDGLNFRSLFIGDVAIDENADGQIDTFFITRKFTARQAAQRFKQLPREVDQALRQPAGSKRQDQTFEFLQAIYPREERDPRRRDNLNMPYVNCIVYPKGEEIVEENGFEECPVAAPRWEVSAGEIYPRSPAMIGLPDARTLQAVGHTLLVGGQRAVDPPTWIADDAAMSAVRTFPGGMTVVDADVVRASGGKPIGQLEMGANIPVGREMQDDYRKMVGSAFFKDVFTLPTEQRMSATEVMERKEEFLRTIGPTLGQLENDYIGQIIRRVFGLMFRAGAFAPPPEVLQGQDVEFEFMSPIQQAKRQVETAGMGRAFEFLAPIIQMQPQVAANIAGDEIIRDAPDIFGIPEKWIKPKQQVIAEQQAAQQAQQAQMQLAGAQQAANVVESAASAEHQAAKGKLASTQARQMQGAPGGAPPA